MLEAQATQTPEADRPPNRFRTGVVMIARLSIVLVYLLAMLVIGIVFRRQSSRNKVEFFLAGRGLGRVLLFFTMAATNFSAFTIFGLSGAGYRIGYAFLPVMGFGTGFMALGMYIVGRRIVQLSHARGYVTPSDFISDRYGSRALKWLFSLVLVVFTLPYLAIQAVASGRSLESLVGIPYAGGALLVTGFIVLYVVFGGMRSVVWTDVVQAVMMIVFTLAAFILIAWKSGGFVRVNREVYASFPGLFSRPGLDGSMLPGVWFGYLFLWFFADPMFPQLFQRFIAARDVRSLKSTVVLYPLITTFLFFLTVSIGVMGRHAFPGLTPRESESVFPLLLGKYASPVLGTLLLTGGLAALMSTMDSQLLTLSSIVTLDFVRIRRREVLVERLVVVALGALGFLIALRPPATILDFINRSSFTGLAVLAPTVIGGLYWKRAHAGAAAASIVAGEALTALFYFNVLRAPGTLPVVPVVAVTAAVFVLVSLTLPDGTAAGSRRAAGIVLPIGRESAARAIPFVLLLALACDFWAWGRTPNLFLGLPLWVWYSIGLAVILSGAYAVFLRASPGLGQFPEQGELRKGTRG
jgi:SSS family solute:Na+ symporter